MVCNRHTLCPQLSWMLCALIKALGQGAEQFLRYHLKNGLFLSDGCLAVLGFAFY